jgi:LysM repeat protein
MAAIPPIDTNLPPVQPLITSPGVPQGQTPSGQYPTTIPAQPTTITPPPSMMSEIAGAAKEYTVARGDSFSTIAKAHGVPVSAIAQANPNVDSRKLKIGQVLQIPAPAAGSAFDAATALAGGAKADTLVVKTYVVKAGDTLTRIARVHGTTVRALRNANNLKTDQLHVGKKLKIPAGKTPAGAPTPGMESPVTPPPSGGMPEVTLPTSNLQR